MSILTTNNKWHIRICSIVISFIKIIFHFLEKYIIKKLYNIKYKFSYRILIALHYVEICIIFMENKIIQNNKLEQNYDNISVRILNKL